MGNKLLASIDVGTNTFRLLIADVQSNSSSQGFTINEIYSERVITRLGDGLTENGILSEHSIDKSITALKRFRDVTSHYNVFQTSAVATSALRDAVNSRDFLIRAKKEADIDIKVISGEHEARITASGMLIDFHLQSPALLIDIGGGSTELILLGPSKIDKKVTYINDDLKPLSVCSLNMGVVHLANKYMEHDPPLKTSLHSMGNEISRHIRSAKELFDGLITEDTILIGTAGTVTALSAICQSLSSFLHEKIHKYNLSVNNVKGIYKTISTMSSHDRSALIPFDLARLDIIVPGTCILLSLMESFGFNELQVSNHGLREGIVIDLFNQLT